jgi:hypothetical protein
MAPKTKTKNPVNEKKKMAKKNAKSLLSRLRRSVQVEKSSFGQVAVIDFSRATNKRKEDESLINEKSSKIRKINDEEPREELVFQTKTVENGGYNAWLSPSFPFVTETIMDSILKKYPTIYTTSGGFELPTIDCRDLLTSKENKEQKETKNQKWSCANHYYYYNIMLLVDPLYANLELLLLTNPIILRKKSECEAYVEWRVRRGKITKQAAQDFYQEEVDKITTFQQMEIMKNAIVANFSQNKSLGNLLVLTKDVDIVSADLPKFPSSLKSIHIDHLVGEILQNARDVLKNCS